MPTLNDCLRLIRLTKESSTDPDSAYASRTRLKRSVVSVGQLAAARVGIPGPVMPEDVKELHVKDPVCAEILHICISLMSKAQTLCQPSEALDSRWRSGWNAVCSDLDVLERALISNQDQLNDV